MAKIPPGKFLIVNRGYSTSQPGEMEKMSIPNNMDSSELANFNSHQRARHKTFNGQLKQFHCLNNTA